MECTQEQYQENDGVLRINIGHGCSPRAFIGALKSCIRYISFLIDFRQTIKE